MNTILTDDEMIAAVGAPAYLAGGRAVEAAVLAKLARQEPVAWVVRAPGGFHDVGYDSLRLNTVPHGTKLYPRPAPQQADRQRVPAEDSPAVCDAYERIDRFLRNNLGDEDYADYSHDLDLLAAAPEAPAQASAVDERAAFEAWVRSKGGAIMTREGVYVSSMTELWWECWKARAALAQKGGQA